MARNYKRKTLTQRHWDIAKDYCNGERLRDIEDKYNVYSGTVAEVIRQIGITPRPTGFASYKIARAWVLQAKNEYAIAIGNKEKEKCDLNVSAVSATVNHTQ